jgi:HPt (histidine-containing phosphotransfer) domain-containing protein
MIEPGAQTDILDPATLDQLLALDEGGIGLIQEMYELFRDDFQGRMDAIGRAIETSNQEELGEVAHAVKGAASTMGANRARASAAALEVLARKGIGDIPAPQLFVQLKANYQEALEALETFIRSKSNG